MTDNTEFKEMSFNNKHKKKKSFLSKNKKHAKEGHFGKGGEIKEEEYKYFITISENIKNVEGAVKDALVQNFFTEFTEETSPRYLCNQISSRMLEDLLPFASITSVQHIITLLGKDVWAMCTDPFASHVLQSTLILALRLMQDNASLQQYDDDDNPVQVAVTEEEKQSFQEYIIKVGKYCCNNLPDFISEPYASHVLRSLLEVLSGVEARQDGKGTSSHRLKQKSDEHITVPLQLEEVLLFMAERLMKLANLPSVISSECGSAVFQCALRSLHPYHDTQSCQPLAEHLHTHGLAQVTSSYGRDCEEGGTYAEDTGVHPVFQCNATARLLEVVVEVSSGDILSVVFSTYFEGRLPALVQHRSANYAVQRLLAAWGDKDTFAAVSAALEDAAETALSARHTGVLLEWARACGRLGVQQGRCCVTMMSALGCKDPEERQSFVSPLLLHLLPYDEYRRQRVGSEGPAVVLHGALLLQEFLKFRKPIKFVKSILDMDRPHLVAVLQDPRGCHVTDVFCRSPYVGEKSRQQLATKMQDDAVSLACSKYGSRSLEALWSVSSPACRAVMCQHLATCAAKVKGSPFGAILYCKFNVRLFMLKDKQDWQEVEQRKANKRRKLQALLMETEEGGAASVVKSKKSKKNTVDDLTALKNLLAE